MNPWLRLALTMILAWLATSSGWADDCSTPEDAMDTIWVGPPLKGAIAVILAAAVNGQTIMSQILKPPGGGATDQPPIELRLEVTTQGRRTDLAPGDEAGLWTYATIRASNAPPAMVAAAQASISFSGEAALLLSAPQSTGGRKAVLVRAAAEDPPPAATLTVRATLAGRPVVAPVVFTLGSGYELEIRTSSEWDG